MDVSGRGQAEGFGKLYPSARPSQQEDERCDDEHDLPSDYISRKELEKGRLSREGKHASTIFFFCSTFNEAAWLHSNTLPSQLRPLYFHFWNAEVGVRKVTQIIYKLKWNGFLMSMFNQLK